MNLPDSHSLSQLSQCLSPVVALVLLLAKLKRPLTMARTLLPRDAGKRFVVFCKDVSGRVAKEMTPTWHWPFGERLAKFVFCVTFYLYAVYCAALYVANAVLVVFGDGPLWKRGAGLAVAGVIACLARWDLIQADTLRRELRKDYGR